MSQAKKQVREDFKQKVFQRAKQKCQIPGCETAPVDAHHIVGRADGGGYTLDNGIALCSQHHLAAEKRVFSVEYLRHLIGTKPAY